ncbi:MAG: phytanoyl-CoA dioxygenase family protein [Candidatus Poribacteria bacterium]|nr:phytanoyl-CoA dioxygenase family protein [Candidatus Poribacteria bacterium]|tara:strand:- start:1133 stop:1885 length:753 start_codon:yes stop_codon:yes gene_type:complete
MKANQLTNGLIDVFQLEGVVKIPQVITKPEAERFRQSAMQVLNQMQTEAPNNYAGKAFHQKINIWCQDEIMRELTFHPNLTAIATRLAGTKLRVWHDHILAKMPELSAPTAFHQDLVKWPYDRKSMALSAWVALQDTTIEMGCMSFLPGSHKLMNMRDIHTSDQEGWKKEMPDLQWWPRLAIPLQVGDCTFHHGLTFHSAGANLSEQWRVAHVVIFVDANATYNGQGHIVTDPLDLPVGTLPPDNICPPV